PAKARVRKQAASVIKRLRMDHLLDVFDQGEKSNHYHKHTHQGTHCPLNCVEVVYKELPHVHPSLSGFGAGGGAGFAVVILLSTALRRLSSPSSLEFRLSMPDFRPFMESARANKSEPEMAGGVEADGATIGALVATSAAGGVDEIG